MKNLEKLLRDNGYKRIIYLSGPITGLTKQVAKATFKLAEEKIISEDAFVFNPIELYETYEEERGNEPSEIEILLIELNLIAKLINEMVMLKGWESSWGATAEHAIAKKKGIKITYL